MKVEKPAGGISPFPEALWLEMTSELIGNLEEVKKRFCCPKLDEGLSELMDFCITVSLFNELAMASKASESGDNSIRFGSLGLLTGILLGMRYAYDYGVPGFVLRQFEELPMFEKQSEDGVAE